MSNRPLIERQASLIEYLLDPNAFGADRAADCLPTDLAGVDTDRLAINGEFSLGKRKDKIAATLRQTWQALGGKPCYDFFAFASRYPQTSPTRFDNAVQFQKYLEDVWHSEAPDPKWLPDLLKFEIAYAAAINRLVEDPTVRKAPIKRPAVRRAVTTQLVRLEHDVRDIFEGHNDDSEPQPRPIILAFERASSDSPPRVFELHADYHCFLLSVGSWTPLTELDFESTTSQAGMISDLKEFGLLEAAE
jgi:hypothetical protein